MSRRKPGRIPHRQREHPCRKELVDCCLAVPAENEETDPEQRYRADEGKIHPMGDYLPNGNELSHDRL